MDEEVERIYRELQRRRIIRAQSALFDWICARCCLQDSLYEDPKRALNRGTCERCGKSNVQLYKPNPGDGWRHL